MSEPDPVTAPNDAAGDTLAGAPERKRKRRWAKRLGWVIAIIMAPIVLGAAFLSTSIGKRFITDQIAQVAPASGLRFEVGRIDGDIYSQAVLRDVVLKDPKGVFLTIPEVELSWRPLSWLWSGLDVRELVARRGRLERLPELLPGDPGAPLLPDFDIRVDRFAIEDLVLVPGLATEQAERVNLTAKVDIRKGRALIDADGTFGLGDRIELLLDAEPDGDSFDLSLDYAAAADGPIAGLAGLKAGYEARIAGEGTWQRWTGYAVVLREPAAAEDGAPAAPKQRVAAFEVSNNSGLYGLLGQISPTISDGSILDRALGETVSLAVTGRLEDSVVDGQIAAVTSALDVRVRGAADLAGKIAQDVAATAILRDPDLLGEVARLEGARLTAQVDGPFRDLTIRHELIAEALDVAGTVTAQRLLQSGVATYDGVTFTLPLDIQVESIATGNDYVDPQLVGGSLTGILTYAGSRLATDGMRIDFPGLMARLALRGDTSVGAYALAGPIEARGIGIENVGRISANTKFLAKFGSGFPWSVRANIAGVLDNVSNTTVANIAGAEVRFSGSLGMGGDSPVVLRDVVLDSERLDARFDSRIIGSGTMLAGTGKHIQYGAFSFDAEIAEDGPRAQLVLADPYPAAGLSNVRVGLAPNADGFAIDVAGGSLLGPFEGALGLVLPANAPARIDINRLEIYRTNVTGAIVLQDAGIIGDLALSGGGLDGNIRFAPGDAGAQLFGIDLTARQARFGGATSIAIASADINASGVFSGSSSQIDADITGTGFQYGALSIANFAAEASITDGRGDVTASIAGRRADRFALKLAGDITPARIALLVQGEYGGRPITMPRRAVLTTLQGEDGDGYRLQPTQIGYDRGFVIVEGAFGSAQTRIEARLAQMPLRLADLAGAELGLGGRLSGVVTWNQSGDAPPIANARVRVDDFTRSGLVLSSKPIDVFVVADLSRNRLIAGARLLEDDRALGRLDARITRLAPAGDLATRLSRGSLDAELSYDGAAEALWRLAAIETFDLTGPIVVTAKATGTLANPRITGNLASDDLRLQSAISGTDIDNLTARGRFAGSRLELTRFSGTTRGGGTVTGSGTVDFAAMSSSRGPRIDLRASVRRARLLAANGLDATLTGPLRIVSDGVGGTIAGRVAIDRASWSLGVAAEDMALPSIATREINRPDQSAATERSTVAGSWRYLVNASAPSRVAVDGLGLDSEWGINIALRGTVDDPRIGGEARLVRGDYTFAGTRFELTRGRIEFDANLPIDPRLDIEAQTSANNTDVTIDITGNAQSPEIDFSSEPALPQEEILARLLFGGSVTSLSATDAVQLGAALAALQGGGGGLDPIGTLRRSIGLDQLRIVSADPALGRGTGVALGKNLGRNVYVELITDGQGYSATQIEYRITSWLALLGSVTTVGRDSILVEISRDY
jgi:translocation and assembly module TamB